jgi:hypothetical protein
VKVTCEVCGAEFEGQRSTAKTCSDVCRQRKRRCEPNPAPVAGGEHPLVARTRLELQEAGKLDSVVGLHALRLAEKLTSTRDTGSATAAVSKEFRAVMAEALADVPRKADSVDELAQRRLQKASGA